MTAVELTVGVLCPRGSLVWLFLGRAGATRTCMLDLELEAQPIARLENIESVNYQIMTDIVYIVMLLLWKQNKQIRVQTMTANLVNKQTETQEDIQTENE